MIEIIITVLILGLLAGFFFSMPIAGPISIIITSNALKGKKRFCLRAAIGASIIEFFYVFIVVYGLAKFYNYYKSYIPYLLIIGALVLFIVAYRIIKTNLDFTNFKLKTSKLENKGGLRVGIFLNLTNPSLIFGWLTSSFIVLSLASSLGLNTGGLDLMVSNSTKLFAETAQGNLQNPEPEIRSMSGLVLSLIYAFGVAVGCYIWFNILTKTIIKYRYKLNASFMNNLIKFLGLILFGIGLYLIWQAINALNN